MSRWQWILIQFTRRLWVRATLIGSLGVVAAALAAVAEHFIPWNIPGNIGADAVDRILNIIATSMLAVTTFSLSVMTSAYGSATSSVSPRATKLLIEDRVTQNVLSTFIGSFLFSIVGIVVLKAGAYGDRGRVILFAVTIGVILLIVVTLLRWIDHLTRLGRVGETTYRVEQAAARALDERWRDPWLGGVPLRDRTAEIPPDARVVEAGVIGYLQHVDMTALSRLCAERNVDLYLNVNPGAFVYFRTPLAWVGPAADGAPEPGDADAEAVDGIVRRAFSIGAERSFDQDPRFGLVVMSEIASRALSPAVNDPGTAIDVIGRQARLLALWARERDGEGGGGPAHPRVHVPPLATADLFEDAFLLLARDGGHMIEVQLRLQKALAALGRMGDDDFREAARLQARTALDRARAAMTLDADKERLGAVEGA